MKVNSISMCKLLYARCQLMQYVIKFWPASVCTCSATNSIIWSSVRLLLPFCLTTNAIGNCPASSSGYLYVSTGSKFKSHKHVMLKITNHQ